MREFPDRNVYILLDGQDLFAGVNDPENPISAGENPLQFTFEEINSRLCRLLP